VFVFAESALLVSSFVLGGLVAGAVPLLSLPLLGDLDSLSRIVTPKIIHFPVTIAVYLGLQRVAARYFQPFMSMPPPVPTAETPAGSAGRRFFIRAACSLALGLVVFLWEDESSAYEYARKDYESISSVHLTEVALDGRLHVVLQTALFGPVAEELLFRGLIFARCLRVLGAIPAYAIGAALFGAMHFDSRSNFSLERMWTMAVSSVYHCALYKWSGTLLAPTAWHVANNSFMVFNDALCSPMVRLTIECTGAHSAFGRVARAE